MTKKQRERLWDRNAASDYKRAIRERTMRRLVFREELRLQTSCAIQKAMDRSQNNAQDLVSKLRKPEQSVRNILQGGNLLTLDRLADIGEALGMKVKIAFAPINK